MGNLVFRYFLEWLRAELRQEVYTESVKRQRRRVESWKRRRIQQMQHLKESGSPDWVSSGLSSNRSGWISGAAENDGQLSEETKRKIFNTREEGIGIDTGSMLWELAKQQGDEKFYEWLEKHVWTVSSS
jgi:hypothetical protein